MDAVSTGKENLLKRFVTLQHAMCQISKYYEAGSPMYIDMLISRLRELNLGCVMFVFPPARRPSCVRGEDMHSSACWMDIIDMASDLVIRTECRDLGADREELSKHIIRKAFESAGMAETGGFPETKYLDVCHRLNLFGRCEVTPDVPYICV